MSRLSLVLLLLYASATLAHNSSRGVSRFVVDERGQVSIEVQLSEQDIVDLLFVDLSDPQQAKAAKSGALDDRLAKNIGRWLKLKMGDSGRGDRSFARSGRGGPCPITYDGFEELKLRTYVVRATAKCPALAEQLTLNWGLSSVGTTLKLTHLGSVEGPGGIKHAVVLSRKQNRHVLTIKPPAWWETLGEFFVLGLEHIALGWDHLLFLLAVILSCSRLKRAFIVVSAFTVAHSVTLALGATGVVSVDSEIVEPLIALSIGLAALFAGVALYRKKLSYPGSDVKHVGLWLSLSLCFLVGLVHGLGFASMLTAALSVGTQVAWPLVGFNVGVEVGQMLAVAIAFPLLAFVFRRFGRAPVFAILAVLVGTGFVVAVARALENT